ncbi:MAG: type IV pilus assembly protein PilM [Fimbriiglobus sp.]
MAKPFGVWGIDIGQCALKALRLEMIDGKPTATAFDFIEHPKILSQPDADPEALTREALEKFFSRNPIGKDEIAISIPGQNGLVRFVKLPPVEEKKVPDIVKFEAKQQIPFPLEEVVWDFQKIGGGETVGGFAMETEIGLFAMKRDIISKFLGHYQGTSGEVHYVQMAPLALCNFATYELLNRGGPDGVTGDAPMEGEDEIPRGKKRCCVVLDIGTDNSNLIITDGGKIIWQRNVNLGGSHFTRALTKEMKLTFAKAEHLKRNAAKSPELPAILKALRPVLTEFVGEVQRSLGFFTNTHRDAHVSYMVGLGSAFKLPGLQKYLAEKLSLDVRKPSTVKRLSGDQVLNDPNFSENVLTFPIAYGLALQGIGQARLKTNLLPEEVRTDRLIRAKKPAVAAATAAFLLGTGILAFGFGTQLTSVLDPKIAKASEAGKAAITLAKGQDSTFNGKKTEIETGQNEIKAIVVGNDERLNWIRMQEVLAAALPRHGYVDKDGTTDLGQSNLRDVFKLSDGTPFSQSTFWDDVEGRRAFEKYRERLSMGIPLEKLYDDDLSQHLAQANVEAVYCRYVPDLKAFMETADTAIKARFGNNIADDMLENEVENDEANKRKKPKAPEGGGWVFEVRGHTMHKAGLNFVKRAVLRNFQQFNTFAARNEPTKRVEAIIPGAADPILPEVAGETKKDRVSHVMLLVNEMKPMPDPNVFNHMGISYVELYASGGAAAGGLGLPGEGGMGRGAPAGGASMPGAGGEGAAAGTPAGPVAPPWTPLGTAAGTGAGAGGVPGMGGPGLSMGAGPGGREGPPGLAMGGGSPGLLPGGNPTAGTGPKTGSRKIKERTEFVLCFVWREPTPTDPTPTAGTP